MRTSKILLIPYLRLIKPKPLYFSSLKFKKIQNLPEQIKDCDNYMKCIKQKTHITKQIDEHTLMNVYTSLRLREITWKQVYPKRITVNIMKNGVQCEEEIIYYAETQLDNGEKLDIKIHDDVSSQPLYTILFNNIEIFKTNQIPLNWKFIQCNCATGNNHVRCNQKK